TCVVIALMPVPPADREVDAVAVARSCVVRLPRQPTRFPHRCRVAPVARRGFVPPTDRWHRSEKPGRNVLRRSDSPAAVLVASTPCCPRRIVPAATNPLRCWRLRRAHRCEGGRPMPCRPPRYGTPVPPYRRSPATCRYRGTAAAEPTCRPTKERRHTPVATGSAPRPGQH